MLLGEGGRGKDFQHWERATLGRTISRRESSILFLSQKGKKRRERVTNKKSAGKIECPFHRRMEEDTAYETPFIQYHEKGKKEGRGKGGGLGSLSISLKKKREIIQRSIHYQDEKRGDIIAGPGEEGGEKGRGVDQYFGREGRGQAL